MNAAMNTRITMRTRPIGEVRADNFSIEKASIDVPKDGELLLRVIYLSVDPYIRLRMDTARSYWPALAEGELLPALTVSEVIESRSPAIKRGQIVVARSGWQSHAVVAADTARVVDPSLGPISTALSVLGMPGVTAHYGLLQLGNPQPGQTVVVSAAAGAVGSVVGQIAKLKGCRSVGIAGGGGKCRYVVDELGFDACIDYRAKDFEAQLEAATPNRVDVDFENVGGAVMNAVLGRLNDYARVALCGAISHYNDAQSGVITRVRDLLVNRASLKGFIISEHPEYWNGALADLAVWLKAGKIKYREDFTDGIESAPAAFMRLLTSANLGKQLVRVSSP
jgi:NADPH-dependent curcumin reductase CurA